MATLRNYVLPLERDALRKRAAMRGIASVFHVAAKGSGQDMTATRLTGSAQKGNNGNHHGPQPRSQPVAPQHAKRFEVVGGWPGVKGKVYLNEPVPDRFGEIIVVFRAPKSGYLKSRVVGHVPLETEKRRSIFD